MKIDTNLGPYYIEGYLARIALEPRWNCPYDEADISGKRWLYGWGACDYEFVDVGCTFVGMIVPMFGPPYMMRRNQLEFDLRNRP